MSVSVAWAETCTITETLPNNTGSAPDATRKVIHTEYNEGGTISAAGTPPATTCASFLAALVAGALSIDLRALTGTNGVVVDGNGLKVQILRVKNLGANALTFKAGAVNPHNLFTVGAGAGQIVQPGAVMMIFTNDTYDDVSATTKVWDVTGTGTQTFEVSIVLG